MPSLEAGRIVHYTGNRLKQQLPVLFKYIDLAKLARQFSEIAVVRFEENGKSRVITALKHKRWKAGNRKPLFDVSAVETLYSGEQIYFNQALISKSESFDNARKALRYARMKIIKGEAFYG